MVVHHRARWRRCSRSPASRWPTAPPTWPTPTVDGLQKIKDWLRDGPLHASDSQINDYIKSIQDAITQADPARAASSARVTEVGTAVGHVLAGFFIVLFSTYFFLADGNRIWAWVVRLSPRAARERVDSSGRVAWISLTQFVRATVIVAATDAHPDR